MNMNQQAFPATLAAPLTFVVAPAPAQQPALLPTVAATCSCGSYLLYGGCKHVTPPAPPLQFVLKLELPAALLEAIAEVGAKDSSAFILQAAWAKIQAARYAAAEHAPDPFANTNRDLSPEAARASEDAARQRHFYSMPCSRCSHRRRLHGRVKCFTPDCKCRGGFHEGAPA